MQNKIKSIKKGTFVKIKYKGKIKGVENSFKIVELVGRLGIDYQNLKSNQNEPKNDENKVVKTFSDIVLIPNTIYQNKEGRLKVRIYPSNNIYHRAKSKYYLDNVEVTKEELIEKGMKVTARGEVKCFTVFLDDIISIG